LYTMYVDRGMAFGIKEFWAFCGLLDCFHDSIHWKWVVDLKLVKDTKLAFLYGGEQLWAIYEYFPMNRTYSKT
jgi:hypothetical protein